MEQLFEKFNQLIKSHKAIAVLESESETKLDAAVSAKENGNELFAAVTNALNTGKDGQCDIVDVSEFDFGYGLALTVNVTRTEEEPFEEDFVLTFATLY